MSDKKESLLQVWVEVLTKPFLDCLKLATRDLPDFDDKTLGTRLKEAREEKGYDVEHMAAYLDMSMDEYRAVESGEKRLQASVLFQVFKYLDADMMGKKKPQSGRSGPRP